jgi:hypothetical protein
MLIMAALLVGFMAMPFEQSVAQLPHAPFGSQAR